MPDQNNKICAKCSILKSLSAFGSFIHSKNNKKYYRPECKECVKSYNKSYREIHKEEISVNNKKNYYLDVELSRKRSKEYRKDNPEKVKDTLNKSKLKNLEQFKEYRKKYNEKYSLENKESLRLKRNDFEKKKRQKDILYKLKVNLRTRLCTFLRNKNIRKRQSLTNYIGCNPQFFLSFLEKEFDAHMNWDNYGSYWNMDHIIPLSYAENEEELIKLVHYLNIRPLKKELNTAKKDKMSISDVEFYLVRIEQANPNKK